MISTKHLCLRPWQEADLDFLQGLRNDLNLQALLLSNARGNSISAVRKWLEEKSTGEDRLFFVVELQETQTAIGYIQVALEPKATQTFQFGVCLAPVYQSQGYGAELLSAMECYLKVQLNAHKIMLQVDEANNRAIACYKKSGYREIGIMQQHIFVQGSLRNVMIMEKCLISSEEHGN